MEGYFSPRGIGADLRKHRIRQSCEFLRGGVHTTQQEMVLRGLELKLDRILDFLSSAEKNKKIEEKAEKMEVGEWVTLTQAWKLQGRLYSLATIRTRADLQPCGGRGVMIGRNKCFRREDVMEWLAAVTPEERRTYRAKFGGRK